MIRLFSADCQHAGLIFSISRNKNKPSTCKLICLLNMIDKIAEKMISNRLLKYNEKHLILSNQFVFKKGR